MDVLPPNKFSMGFLASDLRQVIGLFLLQDMLPSFRYVITMIVRMGYSFNGSSILGSIIRWHSLLPRIVLSCGQQLDTRYITSTGDISCMSVNSLSRCYYA